MYVLNWSETRMRTLLLPADPHEVREKTDINNYYHDYDSYYHLTGLSPTA